MSGADVNSGVAAGLYPLLPEQRRFLNRELPGEHHWNQVRVLTVPRQVDLDILKTAVAALVQRHDSLRMGLQSDDRTNFGVVQTSCYSHDLVQAHDLTNLTPPEAADELTRVSTLAQESFNLHHPPLVRVLYVRMPAVEDRIVVAVHHFVCDGLSFGLLLSELEQLIKAKSAGQDARLSTPPYSASKFAEWLVDTSTLEDIEGQLASWERWGRPVEPVPLDLAGLNTMATTAIASASLDQAQTTALLERAVPAAGVRVRDIFVAAVAAMLRPGESHPELRLNGIGHGRRGLPGQPPIARTVGWLSTRYPIVARIDGSQDFLTQARQVGDQLSEPPMDGAAYGLLRYLHPDLEVRSRLASLGEPDITVNYLGRIDGPPDGLLRPGQESPGPNETETGLREHVHGIDVLVTEGRLEIAWFYSTLQFPADRVQAWAVELLDRVKTGLAL
ncbi:condensation domain-containing protein [Brevibacterium casei]|uniref:condensation domain-containing protein n=1 Tax=Brevibacterium casei TaxID=33889 RepID=UPI00223A77E5|nr:condensation domain-containing protein [Brevibacterium casei]MCT1549646.1 condensation domain-containing protein [Brevibacterium casei]MCT1559183.1 condensation domain-containing protein [Brevibacterium casei]MCT2207611.1 condensation domain-containing protein [Brevibacterium casei]